MYRPTIHRRHSCGWGTTSFLAGLLWALDFNPYTHRTPKFWLDAYFFCSFVSILSVIDGALGTEQYMSTDRYVKKHVSAVHVRVLLCVFSNDNKEKCQ